MGYYGLKNGIQKQGRGLPAPRYGVKGYFYILWTHAWKLVGLNLLFLVFSLPVITMPAALCAMNRVLIKLVREGNVMLWVEFRDEFKTDFKSSLYLGLIFGGALFISYYLLSLGISNSASLFGMVSIALGLLVLIFALGRGAYAFLMRAMFDLSNRDILRNASALSAMRGGRIWAAVGIPLTSIIITAALYPISTVLLLLFWISLTQYTLCFVLNTPIQSKVISPWEEIQKKEKEA